MQVLAGFECIWLAGIYIGATGRTSQKNPFLHDLNLPQMITRAQDPMSNHQIMKIEHPFFLYS